MPAAPLRWAFFRGMRDGSPFLIVVAPFGLLFGVVAREAGWDMAEILGMSVMVIAGASQFTALQLLEDNAPTFMVILTATAVNLRNGMYSASLAPHLGTAPLWQRALIAYCLFDQTYGTAINRFTVGPPLSVAEKTAYFFGSAVLPCVVWYVASVAGAVAGQAIPAGLALDFAVAVTFIALFAPMLRSLPHLAAALVSIVVALACAWMPYQTGLLVAALVAMLTGAGVERWLEGRASGPETGPGAGP